jgi:hypothetical protein
MLAIAGSHRFGVAPVAQLLVDHADPTSSRGANVLDFVNADPFRWRFLRIAGSKPSKQTNIASMKFGKKKFVRKNVFWGVGSRRGNLAPFLLHWGPCGTV